MENRGVGYRTDMEQGRKKGERKNTPSSFLCGTHTHSLHSVTAHTMTACLSVHTLFAVTQDAYLLHAHAHTLLVFSYPFSLSINPSLSSLCLFIYLFLCCFQTNTHAHSLTHIHTHRHTHTRLWGDWCCKLA